MSPMKRILIVDDHAAFRDVLREFLSEQADFEIVGEACNLREALHSVGTLSPHLVLTDLTMPDAHGVEAVTEIKRHYPDVKILVVSSHREYEFKHWCRQAGAAGYAVKNEIYDELPDGIRAVLDGKTHFGVDTRAGSVPDHMIGSVAGNGDRGHLFHHRLR
jgi:DNA-binding NarL/FixJ family response regulator